MLTTNFDKGKRIMLDIMPFLKVAPVLFVALVLPGPDFMLVSRMSLSRGRLAGTQCAAGVAGSILVYSTLSLWGLGLLLSEMLWLATLVKILGGLYLCYLGFTLWRSTFQNQVEDDAPEVLDTTKRNSFLLGFFTNLSNPKAIAFFSSIFAIALTNDTTAGTKILTSLLCALLAFAWFGFVAVALSSPRIRAGYQRWVKVIDRVAGSVLMLFGVKLVFSGD